MILRELEKLINELDEYAKENENNCIHCGIDIVYSRHFDGCFINELAGKHFRQFVKLMEAASYAQHEMGCISQYKRNQCNCNLHELEKAIERVENVRGD